MQRIVKEGKWRYSDDYFEKIIIVEQNWDEFYEEGYSDFLPNLNEQGLVYFIHYGNYYYNEYNNISSSSISIPFLSQKDAELFAEKAVSDLKWND